jgi:butyrate kinase
LLVLLPQNQTNYMERLILAVNPGSTSTKIAVYDNAKSVLLINVKHDQQELSKFGCIADQFDYRKAMIREVLENSGIHLNRLSIVVGRGGLLKPIEGGVYRVNDAMLRDIRNPMGEHESNLGGVIAYALAKESGKEIPAVIVDPTCVDEMEPIARISGMPELPRLSFLHALNQKAIARKFASEQNLRYEDVRVIVAHMGGGTSVGAHCNGRVIDVNNGLHGDGPMSPERSGGVPAGQLVELCFSGQYTKAEVMRKLKGKGGLSAYLGTNDAIEIEQLIKDGDETAKLIYDAMAYQVAKEIGALATVLKGRVDGVLLTGGIAFSQMVIQNIIERISHIAPVKVYPGEGEMDALALNGLLVLNGEISVKEYA